MVALTAALVTDDSGATTTTSTSRLGGARLTTTQVAPGLDPLGWGTGAWTPTSNRPGVSADDAGAVPVGDTSTSRLGGTRLSWAQVAPGLDPLGVGGGERPSASFEGGTDFGIGDMNAGVLIPSAFFRKVTVNVVDEEGEPITNGMYLLALDAFPTTAYVDDTGTAVIYLLRVGYEEFFLAGDFGLTDSYELGWYEADGNPDIDSGVEEVTLAFNTNAPQVGLDLTESVKFS